MYIKRELINLVVHVKCQQDAETSRNARSAEYYGKFVRESFDAIDRWADMAEAAIACMEHSAAGADDPSKCDMAYVHQGAKLWNAFMAARAKAKAITQQ